MFTFKKKTKEYDYIKMVKKQRDDILKLIEDRERLVDQFEVTVKKLQNSISIKTEP